MIHWPSKTPEELKDYGLDWRPALSKLGDPTIIDSSWVKLNGSVVLGTNIIQPDARRTAVKINAGDPDSTAVLRNIVTLSSGPILAADALVRVR